MSIETESRIAFLKSELAETDYLCLKYTDGALSEDEYAPIRKQRAAYRAEINALQGVDARGIAAHLGHGIAHGGKVDDAGNAREILQEHPCHGEADFLIGFGLRVPCRQRVDALSAVVTSVVMAQQILQKHT